MKVLVTGSEGMVGRHLMFELLRGGHRVIGLDKKEVGRMYSQRSFDLTKGNFDDIETADVIVHLAATCSTVKGLENPREAMNDNTLASYYVAEYARKHNIPVIYTSSIKAVALESGQRTPYGMTKWMGEEVFVEWGHTYGLKHIINRPGTIYGPFQDASTESGWLGWFIKASLSKEKVHIFGDGHQVRDVLFVDDYVRLLIDQVEYFESYQMESKIYEVGGGKDNAITILSAVEYLGIENYTFEKKREGDASKYVADNSLASKPNGWKPKIGWQEGIKITKNYFARRANT